MKVLVGFVLLALATSPLEATERDVVSPRWLSANVDGYIDLLLVKVKEWINSKGLDPMQLSDIHKSFSFKPIIITYHGELDLTKGWLAGLKEIKRDESAILNYEAMFLNIRLPLELNVLNIDYDYSAKIMNLGPRGGVTAHVNNVKIYVDVVLDTKKLEIVLQSFHIRSIGKIDIKFSGNSLVDWLSNLLTKLTSTLFHDLIVRIIEGEVRSMLQQAIDDINTKIPGREMLLK